MIISSYHYRAGGIYMKKIKKFGAALLATTILVGQTMPVFAGGSASRYGSIGSVSCEGHASYSETVASASTGTPNSNSSNCYASVQAKMAINTSSSGSYAVAVSNSGSHSTAVYRYNDSGKVIVGCKTTHSVTLGSGRWSDGITIGK